MKTAEDITQKALKNDSSNLNLIEMYFYLDIKKLLIMYHNNQINKDMASKLKRQAIKEYEDNCKEWDFQSALYKEHIQAISQTENLRVQLRKLLHSNEENVIEKSLNVAIELIEMYSGECFTNE